MFGFQSFFDGKAATTTTITTYYGSTEEHPRLEPPPFGGISFPSLRGWLRRWSFPFGDFFPLPAIPPKISTTPTSPNKRSATS